MKRVITLLLSSLLSGICFAQTHDETAIKKAIFEETDAFTKRQLDKAATYFVHDSHTIHQYNNPDGSVSISNGWEAISQGQKAYYKANPKQAFISVDRSKWVMNRLTPDWYWVQFKQIMTDANHKAWKSNETRLMKRVDGHWKIASVIAMFDYKK